MSRINSSIFEEAKKKTKPMILDGAIGSLLQQMKFDYVFCMTGE